MPMPESILPQSNERVPTRHTPRVTPSAIPAYKPEQRQVPRLTQVTDQPQPDAQNHEVPRRLLNVAVSLLLIIVTAPIMLDHRDPGEADVAGPGDLHPDAGRTRSPRGARVAA